MKPIKNAITMGLALGLGAFFAHSAAFAGSMETTRGTRLTTSHHESNQYESNYRGERLTTMQDYRNLRKGDRVSSWCPMMKRTTVTTISNVDTKGHVKMEQTRQGTKMNGCNIVLQRKPGNTKEVNSMMVCPDGTLRPTHCSKL